MREPKSLLKKEMNREILKDHQSLEKNLKNAVEWTKAYSIEFPDDDLCQDFLESLNPTEETP